MKRFLSQQTRLWSSRTFNLRSLTPTVSKFQCSSSENVNNVNVNNVVDKEKFEKELSEHRECTRKHFRYITTGHIPPLHSVNHLHPRILEASESGFENYTLPHKIWSAQETESVEITHQKPKRLVDWMAYLSVQTLRFCWDLTTGYLFGRKLKLFKFTQRQWLLRIVFLETVAGVPGMMFAMVRHLRSLRRMQRDYGWIHTLLSEAENERMHLLTALRLYDPGLIVRSGVIIAQGIMSCGLFIAYIISPIFCHRFVGYLEEEAVMTYTKLLSDIDNNLYPSFKEQASDLAIAYWHLPNDATWRDVFAQMRADEANHRDVNHKLAPIAKESFALNPVRLENINDEKK